MNDILLDTKDFLNSSSRSLWQDILINVITIPLAIFLFRKIAKWHSKTRPSNLLFKNCRGSEEILIFLSQFSVATNDWQKNRNPQLLMPHLKPTPQNRSNIEFEQRVNIDPLWSEADGQCAADIFNVLGRVGKTENVRIGELIGDWEKRLCPMFSIGGNPKTHDLLDECHPINFSD